ncbi:hypothetical protein DNTS_014546 [Danionella cerebrum]|uniref:Uncharacterized protein n=1 Tax=Danionella cerebrum TaxID=2873325 RepID=A0A553RLV2_9TELE|nr:hypothetical protein DNTS_014546 [Danionella translucida]
MKKKGSHRHKHTRPLRPLLSVSQNIVGSRIEHHWKEDGERGLVSRWTGTVLTQVSVDTSLFLVKYDGVDCVYGLRLFHDHRVRNLQLQPGRIASIRVRDAQLAPQLLGRSVLHLFQREDGSRDEWRGLVLSKAPNMPGWFFITYERDPMLFMYQLIQDYRDGDLKILPETDSEGSPPAEACVGLVGKQVECSNTEGEMKTGKIIQQIESKPSVHLIKFHKDYHIYVYDMLMS